MDALIIYTGEGRTFDLHAIRSFISQTPGVTEISESSEFGAVLSAEYRDQSEMVLMRLKSDLETISISQTGNASVHLAFLIQQAYPEPLHVIDWDYSLDLLIHKYRSPQELSDAMLATMEES